MNIFNVSIVREMKTNYSIQRPAASAGGSLWLTKSYILAAKSYAIDQITKSHDTTESSTKGDANNYLWS